MTDITESEVLRREKSIIPRWFGWGNTPVLDGLLSGFAAIGTHAYNLLQYVKRQTRISTAEGAHLDMIAYDFFGRRISRRSAQDDTHFRIAILREIFRVRGTRQGVIDAVEDITGNRCFYFEPANPMDTGGIGVASSMGWSMAGRWGSLALPYQAFCVPIRPAGSSIPNVNGWGGGLGGYGIGAVEWASLSYVSGEVTDADIYRAINDARSEGTIVWASIQSGSIEDHLDLDFLLDVSLMQ